MTNFTKEFETNLATAIRTRSINAFGEYITAPNLYVYIFADAFTESEMENLPNPYDISVFFHAADRKEVHFSQNGNVLTNSNEVQWIAGENLGTIGRIAVMSGNEADPTVAHPIFWGNLVTPTLVNVGDILRFPVGSIQITLD